MQKHNKHWEKATTGISAVELVSTEELVDDEFEDEYEDLQTEEVLASTADLELQVDLEDDIRSLQTNDSISGSDADYLIQKAKFRQLQEHDIGMTLPVYATEEHQTNLNSKTSHNKRHASFVEVSLSNGHTVYLWKTTLVWMLQESERLSSDRLLHVREKQPYSSATCTNSSTSGSLESTPIVAGSVSTGEICVFLFQINDGYSWDIGKILQFSSDKRNGQHNKINCDEFTDVSVLCQWYTQSDGCDTQYSYLFKLHNSIALCSSLYRTGKDTDCTHSCIILSHVQTCAHNTVA